MMVGGCSTTMTLRIAAVCAILNFALCSESVEEVESSSPPQQQQKPPPQVAEGCGVWLATSTIPGAGLGIFAGKSFHKGDEVTPGDATIPLNDLPFHNNKVEFTNEFLWDEYTWNSDSFTGMNEEAEDVSGASFGIGALPNCLFPQVGVDESHTLLDNAGLHRSRDPGVGAFTPFHDRRGMAVRNIVAGEEIFVDYGYDYFKGNRIQTFGMIPFLPDYTKADDLLTYFKSMRKRIRSQQRGKQRIRLIHDLYEFILNASQIWPSRTLSALPANLLQDPELEKTIFEKGTIKQYENRSRRTVEWLHENGSCLDHLRVRKSTIPQAGRGAFAVRAIPKDHVIAPVPLIHVPDRSILIMYADTYSEAYGDYVRNSSAPIHQQLLLNYCFGHNESTLLLCPYGIVSAMINHSKKPNARIAWSRQMSRHLEWLEQPLSEWVYNYYAGLTFDYIATRDIAAGEEVLIDYGDAWQRAWDEHVAKWSPPTDAFKYKSAADLNDDIDGQVALYNEIPQLYNVQNVELLCREEYRVMSGLEEDEEEEEVHTCRVVRRSKSPSGETVYMAEIFEILDEDEQSHYSVKEVLFSVPRDAFLFRDTKYSRDHAQTWSFRHDIAIPEDLMPDIWKNKREG